MTRALLAVESATQQGSVAWLEEGEVRASSLLVRGPGGRALAEVVRDLAGGELSGVACYALSIGPGSFTGLRVGLAFVKGLALAFPRPVVPVSTLALVASGVVEEVPVLAVLDARGGEVYAGLYQGGAPHPRLPDGLYRIGDLGPRLGSDPVVVTGDAVPALVEAGALPIGARVARAEDASTPLLAERLGRMAWSRFEAGLGVAAIDLEPAYHQRAAAERKAERKPDARDGVETSVGDPSASR